jgi:hypothetical protein
MLTHGCPWRRVGVMSLTEPPRWFLGAVLLTGNAANYHEKQA